MGSLKPRILEACVSALGTDELIGRLLPEQGSIELQHDRPGKLHDWHHHETDETLVIIQGALRFFWEGTERTCRPGDVIELPAGVRHGSVALEDGAVYAIVFRIMELMS